jgi:GTP-binding protein HflX
LDQLRDTLKVKKERALLVGAVLRGEQDNDNLKELSSLAETAGAIIVDKFQQRLKEINPATYIGKGKAQQLAERVEKFNGDVVIFDNDLSPRQIRELEEVTQVKVIDRSELILDIFATRARTRQAKLQVDLAQLEYTAPRLTNMWTHLDTVTGAAGGTSAGAVGGIGTRGTGEKQIEIDRRLVNKRITDLKRELSEIDEKKLREIGSRKGLFKICLAGYTNSGKSTLLNKVTDSDVLVEDKLFATLDTRTKKWKLDKAIEVLLSDTVGFVKNLPHHLVASFKATLEEAVNADLLLHIVDVSDQNVSEKLESVEKVLDEIGCGDKPILTVLNKVDVLDDIERLDMLRTVRPESVCISARTGQGLEELNKKVLEKARGNLLMLKVQSSQGNGKVQSFLRACGEIIDEQYSNNSVITEARLGERQLPKLKSLHPKSIEYLSD